LQLAVASRQTLAAILGRAGHILAFGFAGAFGRPEPVALEVADLSEVPDGLRVRIRRSKTNQEGEGAEVPFCMGAPSRPVQTSAGRHPGAGGSMAA
jgi:hypothetical protein